jgi:hypothetical protein
VGRSAQSSDPEIGQMFPFYLEYSIGYLAVEDFNINEESE